MQLAFSPRHAVTANPLLVAQSTFAGLLCSSPARGQEQDFAGDLGALVPLAYLTWRAPFMMLSGEAGIECAPAFTWAPAGSWIATLSIGGFLR